MAPNAATKIDHHAVFDLTHLFSQGLVLTLISFYFKV
jgi:hypothetical protein